MLETLYSISCTCGAAAISCNKWFFLRRTAHCKVLAFVICYSHIYEVVLRHISFICLHYEVGWNGGEEVWLVGTPEYHFGET